MKLTPKDIDNLVKSSVYFSHGTLTICVLNLTNGGMVTGESNVIDSANFDPDVGMKLAYSNAKDKIWQLEGYAIKTRGQA